MKSLRLILAAMASVAVLAGFLVAFYHWGISVERNKWVGKFYPSDVEIYDVVPSDLAPSIDFSKQAKTIVTDGIGYAPSQTAIEGDDVDVVQLAPYRIRWYRMKGRLGIWQAWEAELYVASGTGEAIKKKLKMVYFVESVRVGANRVFITLYKYANVGHIACLNQVLIGDLQVIEREK